MAYINAGRKETVYFPVTIRAGRKESFSFSNKLNAGRKESFQITKSVASAAKETFTLRSKVLASVYSATPVEGQEWINYCNPIVIPSLVINGGGAMDASDYIYSYSLKKTLGGKTTLDIQLKQVEETLLLALQPDKINPVYTDFGNSSGALCAHNYTRRVTMEFSLTYGFDQTGFATYTAPLLLPTEPSFDGETLDWGGEDFSALLEMENQTMTDINGDYDTTKTSAHATIRAICASVGINNVVINFPDYTIRLLRRTNGRKIDWIDQICRPYQAKRSCVGGTLYLNRTIPSNALTASNSFLEGFQIEEGSCSVTQDMSDYKNKFTISRQSPNGGIIGEQECVGPQCVGRTINITLDEPVQSLAVQYEATNGNIIEFTYFDQNNNPVLPDPVYALGPSGPTYIGEVKVARIEATYKASVGTGSFTGNGLNITQDPRNLAGQVQYTPKYNVVVTGKPNSNFGLDVSYNLIAQDTAGISYFGLRQEYGDIEDPIIPDAKVAQDYLNALLIEATRKVWKLTLKTRCVDPTIEPGQCVQITDYQTNQNNTKWLVETVTIDGNEDGTYMTLQCSRGY